MKRLLFALLLLPVVAAAQYRASDFSLDISRNATRIPIGITFDKDTVISLNVRSEIAGLSISGIATLGNNQDSYVRVILKDDYNYEHLIYENFPLLTDSLVTAFDNTAIETLSLDNITPQSIRVELHDATLQLESLYYTTTSANRDYVNSASIQRAQCQYIADILNENLIKRNMTWRAGVTSVAEKSYEEKKAMFGGKVPQLYGFDYYKGGIFVMPGSEESVSQMSTNRAMATNQYVSEWDWRNRHGKNWMTPVKFFNGCGACWAFASISTVEAYANLYFNKQINFDLSEAEIVSCSKLNGCEGGTEGIAFNYIKNNGVVNESCFPFATSQFECSEKCSNPEERIYIQNYRNIPINEDSIKRNLFKCPLAMAIGAWAHSMVVVGYKTIEVGDKIFFGNYIGNNSNPDSVIINNYDHQSLIGRTAWLMENSWQQWGDHGFLYVVVDMYYPKVWRALSLSGKITSLNYDDSNIVCKDADGDGYYFWGISVNKPAGIPEWVPEIKDGDESNPTKGCLDDGGNLEDLTLYYNSEHVVSGIETHTSRESIYTNIRIPSASTLCVKNVYNIFGQAKIYIESGGELVIDNGVITNACVIMSSGSKLTIKNGGKLIVKTNTTFNAPLGATVDVLNGGIFRSEDF